MGKGKQNGRHRLAQGLEECGPHGLKAGQRQQYHAQAKCISTNGNKIGIPSKNFHDRLGENEDHQKPDGAIKSEMN